MVRLAAVIAILVTGCGGSSECDGEVGHDEDGDGSDDGCDACPYIANDEELDEDGDGVAGACDPDPANSNNVLKFAGFSAEDSELTLTGGAVENGAFRVRGGGPPGAVLWGSGLDNAWIVAGVTVDAIDPSGFREVGVVVDAKTTQAQLPDGTYCAVGEADVPEPSTDYIEVFVRQAPGADETLATDQAVLYLSGLKSAVIQAQVAHGATPSLQCAFGVPGNRALIAGTRTPAPVPGQVGLFGFAVDVKFSFLYVLTR